MASRRMIAAGFITKDDGYSATAVLSRPSPSLPRWRSSPSRSTATNHPTTAKGDAEIGVAWKEASRAGNTSRSSSTPNRCRHQSPAPPSRSIPSPSRGNARSKAVMHAAAKQIGSSATALMTGRPLPCHFCQPTFVLREPNHDRRQDHQPSLLPVSVAREAFIIRRRRPGTHELIRVSQLRPRH
jgi:hypothetical protein